MDVQHRSEATDPHLIQPKCFSNEVCKLQRAHCIHTPGLNFPTSFGSLYVPHNQSQYMKRWPKFDLNSAWWT